MVQDWRQFLCSNAQQFTKILHCGRFLLNISSLQNFCWNFIDRIFVVPFFVVNVYKSYLLNETSLYATYWFRRTTGHPGPYLFSKFSKILNFAKNCWRNTYLHYYFFFIIALTDSLFSNRKYSFTNRQFICQTRYLKLL